MSRFTTPGGGSGTPGPQGPQGPQGPAGDTPDLSSCAGDILPSQDNQYVLGNSENRWKSISIGEGTIFITDATLGTEVGLTIDNGVFFIDGIAQAQLPDLAVTNLTFADDTVQTTAYTGNAGTGDFTFEESTMSTNEDMDISVLGVPGTITLSAYSGVNVQSSAEFGLTTNKIITTSNGATDNIKIGDDAYVGDGNIANAIVIKGQQTATNGGVVLGSAKTEKVTSDGSNLSLNANNDIVLYPGSSYAYIGTPQIDGSNRVAKISDITNSTSVMKFVSSPPAHDYGAAGDKKNSFAYDDIHLFICTADYVNNSTVIWKRINWAGGNW